MIFSLFTANLLVSNFGLDQKSRELVNEPDSCESGGICDPDHLTRDGMLGGEQPN